MKPLYFGLGARRLFGIYSPPASSGRGNRAVLLCAPWGHEYLRSHRSIRQLSLQLNRAGFHVLRFDYFGTGDSAGELIDTDPAGWIDDIEMALEELMDASGARRVSLVGLRLGATMASIVAARRRAGGIESLVLWDPIASGKDYAATLMDAATVAPHSEEPLSSRSPAGPVWEVQGFLLSTAMVNGLGALGLVRPQGSAARNRTLVLTSESKQAADAARQMVSGWGNATAHVEHLPALPAWQDDRGTGAGAIPVAVLQRIVDWLS